MTGSTCAYFFKGSEYLRYDVASDVVNVGPAPIARFWPALPAEFQSDLDAAVNWGDGHAYFFKGAGYVRYNIATDAVDVGPAPIAQFWKALPVEFQADLDAAVNWGNGKVYFFKGRGYLRYDVASDMVDVGPAPIAQFWKALPVEFQADLDAAVNWGNGKVYFFKGRGYLRYDIGSDLVDVGPASIAEFWKALPVEFQSDIDAAVNWSFPLDLAGLLRAGGMTVHEVGGWRHRARPGAFTPVGIMMHHTGGPRGGNSLPTIVQGRPDLPGPLANFHVERTGVLNVVSGGKSNHAGPGAQRVLDDVRRGIPPTDTAAQRGLPDGPSGNAFFYGFENQNSGDGKEPWPEAQLDAMARAAAALCEAHCWNANRVISHAEWTSRKPDPRGIDMNDFRARVSRFL
jgi:hypothetical protein